MAPRTTYRWQGIDDASRVDVAVVRFGNAALRAHGTSTCDDYGLVWSLDVGEGWITRSLEVAATAPGWSRSLRLARRSDGSWTSSASTAGDTDLPPPGIVDAASVDGALDCDLGLCPVTNVMPIRRLQLLERAVPETPLVMAWVEVPSLRVLRSEQIYASSGAGAVRYANGSRDFAAELRVDRDGMVVEYPSLARRVA